jgi:hypothetical protein
MKGNEMKYNRVLLVIFLAVLALGIRERVLHMKYRKALVNTYTSFQMDQIESRALNFMELKLGKKSLPSSGRSLSSCKKYEIRIGIPSESAQEFREWMQPAGMTSVAIDGWPSSHGSSSGATDEQIYYRVYYGKEPDNWN